MILHAQRLLLSHKHTVYVMVHHCLLMRNQAIYILAVVWERVGAVVASCMQSSHGHAPMQLSRSNCSIHAAIYYATRCLKICNGNHASAATCPGSVFAPVRWVRVEAVCPQVSRCAQLCCRLRHRNITLKLRGRCAWRLHIESAGIKCWHMWLVRDGTTGWYNRMMSLYY